MLPELNIVQYNFLNSIFPFSMKNQFFFHFSNEQQEMEFQVVFLIFSPSILPLELDMTKNVLPVRSCKISILSFTSRAKHCAVSFILNSVLQLSTQNRFF